MINEKVLQLSLLYFSVFFLGANCFILLSPILVQIFSLILMAFVIFLENDRKVKISRKVNVIILLIITFIFLRTSVEFYFFSNRAVTELIQMIIYIFLALFIFQKMETKHCEYILNLNAKVLLFFTSLGIVGFFINIYFKLPTIYIANLDGRDYLWKFFYWDIESEGMTSIINIGKIYGLNRLQTIFDEPGTYALLLLPAIMYYTVKKQKRVFILIFGLLLSASVGGIISLLICISLYLIKNSRKNIGLIISLCLIGTVIFFCFSSEINDFFQLKFGIGKYRGTFSSYGAREIEYKNSYKILLDNPFGVDRRTDLLNKYGYNISSEILRELYLNGILAFVIRVCLEINISFLVLRTYFTKKRENVIPLYTMIPLIMMGYQRMTFINNFYTYLLVIISLKLITNEKRTYEGL